MDIVDVVGYARVSTLSNNQIYTEINELESALKQIVDFTVSKLYSIDEIVELIDHVKVKSVYGTYETNGNFVDTPCVLLLFVFKPLQTLIEFAEKYLDNDSTITFESITWSTVN